MISLGLHVALVALFAARIIRGQPAPTWIAAVVLLAMVAGLIIDAIGDMFDYRLLRGILRRDPS